jgi:hypothetical protein
MEFIFLNNIFIWSSLICFFNLVVWFVDRGTKVTISGDQSYHIYSIKKLKWNKHRFFKHSEFLLSTPSYPHLFHLLLSFLPLSFIVKKARHINMIIENLVMIFSIIIIEHLTPNLPKLTFFILAFCVIFSPNLFNHSNARNNGINTRNIGTIFTILFFLALGYSIELEEINYFILISGVLFALTIMTSQMGMQAIIIGCSILLLLTFDVLIILCLISGVIIAYIFFRTYFTDFVKKKFEHLKLYSRYLADIHILPSRPSIWLDFFQIHLVIKEKGIGRALGHYWTSPLLRILWDFPFNSMIMFLLITEYQKFESNIFLTFSLLPMILFVLISFRKTRFLGEPERYSEYFQIFSVVSLSIEYPNNTTIWLLCLIFTILRIIGNTLIMIYFKKINPVAVSYNVDELASNIQKGDIIAANNLSLTNPLLGFLPSENFYKLFTGGIHGEYSLGIHFSELFVNYPELEPKAMFTMIECARANVCLIPTEKKLQFVDKLNEIGFYETIQVNTITIYRRDRVFV